MLIVLAVQLTPARAMCVCVQIRNNNAAAGDEDGGGRDDGPEELSLAGWVLRSDTGQQRGHVFPEGFSLRAGQAVTVFSGPEHADRELAAGESAVPPT